MIGSVVRASALFLPFVSAAAATCAHAAPLNGPETWFHVLGGNVRKDGLRLDLEAIRGAGLSGVHFFHIGGGDGND